MRKRNVVSLKDQGNRQNKGVRMSNEDVIASVVESQSDGQLDTGVGQDEGTNNEESLTQDWEAQAKYHQSEKDKLYVENQQLKQYEKVGKFLESRPDLVQNLMS